MVNLDVLSIFRQLLRRNISREEIIWCYRNLLGREPESETAIHSHLKSKSFKHLVECFVHSSEFLANASVIKDTQPAKELDRFKSMGLITPKQNEALAKAEFEAGVIEVSSSPIVLGLETTSRCNLRCVMCPHAIDAVDRPKHLEECLILSLDKVISQSSVIQLHGIGEPLTSPVFWSMLKHLSDDCQTQTNTNLTVLDERRLSALIGSNLKSINVSLDAARPETYRKIRGYSFEAVIGNIRRFVEARQASGKIYPLLYMNMTLMRSNIEEVLEFIDLSVELGAAVVQLWHLNRWTDTEMQQYVVERDGWVFDYQNEGLWNYPALSNDWLRKAEVLARSRGIPLHFGMDTPVYFDEQGKETLPEKETLSETVKDCDFPWTAMQVTSDGSLKVCCFSGVLGNLNNSSAEDIWNSPTAIELRKFIKADKIHPLCTNAPCKFVQNMPEHKPEPKQTNLDISCP